MGKDMWKKLWSCGSWKDLLEVAWYVWSTGQGLASESGVGHEVALAEHYVPVYAYHGLIPPLPTRHVQW